MAITDGRSGYEIRVIERDGTFFLRVPELGVLVENHDLAAGYSTAARSVAELIEHYRRAGFGDELPPAAGGAAGPRADAERALARETLPFIVKAVVASAIVASFMLWAASPLANALHRLEVAARTGADGARAVLADLASPDRVGRAVIDGTGRLARALESLTPERKEEMHRNLAVVVRELRPFAADLAPLFDPAAGEPAGAPAADQRAPRAVK